MRILWLSMNSGLYHINKPDSNYNGGGWISSLQKLIENNSENTLALAFITHIPLKKEIQNKTVYYPIYEKSSTKVQKLIEYYGGYKNINKNKYLEKINAIIEDFKPDIIHLFGLENPLVSVLEQHLVPVVVHLQGLLSPIDNAFLPVNFNKLSFLFPFSKREWIIRNGYIFAKNNIHVRGKRELSLFKKVESVMGRTNWDYQVSQLLAPQSKYFHVDEVLREPFYKNAGKWRWSDTHELKIISTLSDTVYKGLDTILKTAQLIKTQCNISFKWIIVGLSPQTPIVGFFEKKSHIISKSVNVEYIGVLDANQLCHQLLSSHVYVHPSYIDNSPNSVCEAQLLGMPVIGTFVGGIPSLINNFENGILVPANAPYELAYLLKKLYLEKELAKKLGHEAYNTASKRHNKENILFDVMNVYKKILE